ncbi:regulatory protein, tetR family [Salinihabitans flavidus]|uniref:Regulatory protein, tetR family n=2 Tax=Salinihabitans flavidus TaxID=569882 RepID=A0A1H8ML01_9RHOB|nr:regulatory protein, tetR family [Salinihabitans flavidus]
MGAATVRAIAARAEVTQGLIRHYFDSKEALLTAAYEAHMHRMTQATADGAGDGTTARARLAGFVVAGLTPPVVDGASVALWAGFLKTVRENERMRATHEATYRDFRDRLEVLIAAALEEEGRHPGAEQLRRLGIAANAVIDGLWLEGGALPGAFADGELPDLGLMAVGAIVGLNLTSEDSRA